MSKIQTAIGYLHEIDIESEERKKQDRVSETAIFIVTLFYVITLMSFRKYMLGPIIAMCIYPLAISIIEDISLIKGIARIKYIILLLLFVGIANPIMDREVIYEVNNLHITGGMISLLTLFLKGVLSVLACYIMAVRIGITGVAGALFKLRVPGAVINTFLLIYRYIIVFLKELDKLLQAYKLRAYGKRGVGIKNSGSFAGLMLLRSVDRAEAVSESMLLRGYSEDKFLFSYERDCSLFLSILFVLFWVACFIALRSFDIISVLGGLYYL